MRRLWVWITQEEGLHASMPWIPAPLCKYVKCAKKKKKNVCTYASCVSCSVVCTITTQRDEALAHKKSVLIEAREENVVCAV